MTDARHTPGPWVKFNHEDDEQSWGVEGGDGYTIAEELSLADARLIAAAPELLEALRLAMPLLEAANARCTNDTAFIAVARAATAKATGETP